MKFIALIAVLFFAAASADLISDVCGSYGGWDQGCCRCIVDHESSGNPSANNGAGDIGLFQISQNDWSSECGNLYDAWQNTQCAVKIYQQSGNNWGPWSTAQGCGC